jgi:hypothetical protein
LFIKITLALVSLTFVMAESQAQTNRKNELGLLLGATVTPELKATAPAPANLEIGSGITFQLTYARQLSKGRKHLECTSIAKVCEDGIFFQRLVPEPNTCRING